MEREFNGPTQIGEFSRIEYEENLKRASSFSEVVKAICAYAQNLESEQKSYERISPFGGEDINVADPVDTAILEIEKLMNVHPAFKGKPYKEIKLAAIAGLGEAGKHYAQTLVNDYEDNVAIANGSLREEYKKWQQNLKKAEFRCDQKVQRIWAAHFRKAKDRYTLAHQDVANLQKRRMFKFFRPKKFQQEMDSLVETELAAMQDMHYSIKEIKSLPVVQEMFRSARESVLPPVLDGEFVDRIEKLLAIETHALVSIHTDRKEYEAYSRLLGKTPISLPQKSSSITGAKRAPIKDQLATVKQERNVQSGITISQAVTKTISYTGKER